MLIDESCGICVTLIADTVRRCTLLVELVIAAINMTMFVLHRELKLEHRFDAFQQWSCH